MLQFYFLSILLNIVAGLVFIYAGKGNGEETSLVLSDSDDFNPETDDLNFDAEASSSEKKSSKKENLKNLAIPFLGDKTLQLVVGILSALTGLMKLLSPIQYDVAVVGDLIPALAGLAAGAVLLLDWYQERSEVELSLPETIQNIYTGGRKYLGIFCIIAAVLHFIFPLVLFL
ncbi:hypothetical protein [Treponema sp. UBA3813]|uniref:hypothetical protein n=1 Tax=Treponema sp. UBA3813 TaxID=1947715 RepID=UPI0025F41F9C|nr:hypothetical protein [Treponema sp. UBA3813]